MSKAKDKAENAYLDYFLDGRLRNCSRHEAFIYGYCQAEKDLELTCEDIQSIRNIISEMMIESYTKNNSWSTHEEFSKEVLKRFKETKD